MRHTFMALGNHGRLGNQLWQIASTLGLAVQHGDAGNVAFPAWRYAEHFNVPYGLFGHTTQAGDHDPGLVHLQELVYLNGLEDQLREWFSPRPETWLNLTAKYPDFFKLKEPCALHIRRGDSIGREQWHPIQPLDYYLKAMDIVRERRPETTFVVFSDGIDWCHQHLPKDNLHFVSPTRIAHTRSVENDVDHEEFFLMRSCVEHVIANSTFSWWAAWLSDNRSPIYPSQWFGPSYPALQETFRQNFIVDTWIEVPS